MTMTSAHRLARSALALALTLAACAAVGCKGSDEPALGEPAAEAGRGPRRPLCTAEGCACSDDQPPLPCQPDGAASQLSEDGELLCLEGTRVCRDGRLSACENVRAYAPPQRAPSALVDPDAVHSPCSPCEANCFLAVDNFNPDDGPLDGGIAEGVVFHGSGAGITLEANEEAMPDGGMPSDSLFIAVDDGLTGSATGTTVYHPAAADVYLLLDHSSSMAEANAWLSDRAQIGGDLLAPGLSCSGGDQTLLMSGVTGALACMVDDVRVGGGMFRDIPFAPYSSDQSRSEPARSLDAKSEIAYRHGFAFTSDLSSVGAQIDAIGNTESSGDPDFAGSQLPALHSVATGAAIFTGLGRMSTPAAPSCGSGQGYPCFRANVDRIVVLSSNAPMHNGMGSGPSFDYDPTDLGTLMGTVPGIAALPPTNDNWSTAASLSNNVTSELRFFSGNSSSLGAQIPGSVVGCNANDSAPDAVFSFGVVAPGGGSNTVPITVSAEGTSFASSLALYRNPPLFQQMLTAGTAHEDFASALELGDVRGGWIDVAGNTAMMRHDLQAPLYGGTMCDAATRSGDAVFAFDVGPGSAVPLTLTLDMDNELPFLGVYRAGTSLPVWPAVTGPIMASGNRDATPANVLTLTPFPAQPYLSAVGSTAGMGADYSAETVGNGICNPSTDSPDVSFKLSLTERRRLRIDTDGSSFDTMLALHDGPPLPRNPPSTTHEAASTHNNGNEDAASAWPTGAINGGSHVFRGSTAGMSADMDDAFSCGLDDACPDAMYRVTISARTTIRMEVSGTGFEPGAVLTRADPSGASGGYGSVAGGGAHSCAISGGAVFCWGQDADGQLGNGGSVGDPDSPAAVQATGLSGAAQVCAGDSHSCAVLRDGRVACWGAGADGRLGTGSSSDQTAPLVLSAFGDATLLGRAVQVACGAAFSCALLEDGRIACFGANGDGQLGDGGTTGRALPEAVDSGADRFTQLTAGARHACAVRAGDDALFCWGDGSFGKLGDGGTSDNLVPARVGTLTGVRRALTGSEHSCAVLSSGKVLCWGRNQAGQLGIGSSDGNDHAAPLEVRNSAGTGPLVNARTGFAGSDHSCVSTLEGLVYCWGDDSLEQLGNGAGSASTRPVKVAVLAEIAEIAGSSDHGCAARRNGPLYCWGDNADGQLGDGSASARATPVAAHPGGSAALSFGNGQLEAGIAHACRSLGEAPEAGCQLRFRSTRAYQVCKDQARTWAGAGQACESVGMELARVSGFGENSFLSDQLDLTDKAWIGAKRESTSSDWLNLNPNIELETLDGDRIWHTDATECIFDPSQVCIDGRFESPAASDLVSSDPYWTSSSTFVSREHPSPLAGHNCVTLDAARKWETRPCASVEPFDGRGGRFAAPPFAGGTEHPYLCEERRRYTDVTLDPGDYYVTVKGVDDNVVGNGCSGSYELRLTDIDALSGGQLLACNDDGVRSASDSVIEAELDPGDYYVTLKGWRSTDQGNYRLTVRDLDAVTTTALDCDEGGGISDPAQVSLVADPNTRYYAVVKGRLADEQGPYTLTVRDTSAMAGTTALACDQTSSPSGDPQLNLPLTSGTYYAVLKGSAPGAAGDYQLSVGGASPIAATFEPAGYQPTVDALKAANIRVASVLSCAGQPDCNHATSHAERLAQDTMGVARVAATAEDVPREIVRAIEQLEQADTVTGSLVFAPDANPGFTPTSVTALADPANRCAGGTSGATFSNCSPGALPSFVVSLHNPALAPVAFSPRATGEYVFTLHVESRRGGKVVGSYDLPVTVLPTGAPPAETYTTGSYFQDIDSPLCLLENRTLLPGHTLSPSIADQRPSWDALRFKADVRPDTQLDFRVCTAEKLEELADCASDGPRASGMRRALTVTAGTGSGTPCTVATQAADCPYGYCSPYTRICNYLEGAACLDDGDCPGSAAGRCRSGPSDATLGKTCEVLNLEGNPASALDGDNFRPVMRVEAQLASLGDGSRTPSLFFWEAWYRCRMVE